MELITNFSYLLFTGMRMRNNLQWKSDNVGILFGDTNPSVTENYKILILMIL